MMITTVKKKENGFLINNTLFVPSNNKNSDYKKIQDWISNGGTVDPEFTTDELKEKRILEIKAEACRRIVAIYPEYKQLNINTAVSEIYKKAITALKNDTGLYNPTPSEIIALQEAESCKEFIDNIRKISNELEASLDLMTEEELNNFDPNEDSNWR